MRAVGVMGVSVFSDAWGVVCRRLWVGRTWSGEGGVVLEMSGLGRA